MIHQDLQLKKNVKNPIGILRLQNLTLSFSKKHFLTNEKLLLTAFGALEKLVGLKSKGTIAQKSISDFKLRSGQLIGCKINVCGDQAYSFIDKLVTQVLPANNDQHVKNNRKLVTSGNVSNPSLLWSTQFTGDIFEIRSSSIDSNTTFPVSSFRKLSLKNRKSNQNSSSNDRTETLSVRPVKLKNGGNRIAVLALNLSDPFQSCELEDNFEIFENVDCIELRLTISVEKSSYYINYGSLIN